MKLIKLGQGSPDWIQWRLGGIGGSDAPAVLGLSPYATRAELLLEKATGAKREVGYAARRGNRLEPEARARYALESGMEVRAECLASTRHEWRLASMDGLAWPVGKAPADSRDGLASIDHLAEIKCWDWMHHDLCLNGLVPLDVIPQIQHQLDVADNSCPCRLVSYSKNSKYDERDAMVVLEVKPDPAYQEMLLAEEEKFWLEVLELKRQHQRSH